MAMARPHLLHSLLAAAAVAAAAPASAQQFSLYLQCSGQVQAKGRQQAAHLDLALRDNNMTALIQRSDVLPVGEKMKYQASPALYSMTIGLYNRSGAMYYDWLRGTMFVWNPDLLRLHTVRLSVDRQTAALQGEMLDGKGAMLGRLKMHCEPKDNDSVPAPKF